MKESIVENMIAYESRSMIGIRAGKYVRKDESRLRKSYQSADAFPEFCQNAGLDVSFCGPLDQHHLLI
jgi:hypothetical protein